MKTTNEYYAFESTGEMIGFSWSGCERCGNMLGGDRYEWVYKDNEGHTQEGEVCIDCLFEIND